MIPLRGFLAGFDHFVLVYFLVLSGLYLLLTVLASIDVLRAARSAGVDGQDDLFAHPLTPGISVIVPARNEALSILACARGVLSLRYPELELIIVDDGSTDDTFALVEAAYSLVEVRRFVAGDVPVVGTVRSVHVARTGTPVLVVRKDHGGTRADALNAGLNVATKTIVCFLDADSVLDERALLSAVKPFVDDPEGVVGVGGVVRVANGCAFEAGRLVSPEMPSSWIERIQIVEYLRSFLLGRTAWSKLGGLMIISGAFGLFRLETVIDVGGFDVDSIAEDFELVARLHHRLRAGHGKYRIVCIPEPAAWTEVPATLGSLASQRKRWARGLAETLFKYRRMTGNPRHGVVGIVALPYYLAFECLGAFVELTGSLALSLGLALGVVDVQLALLVAAVAFSYAMLLSVAALALEEFSFHRYPRTADLAKTLGAVLLENVGFRQLHAWWRVQGTIAAIRGNTHAWESPERTGSSADSARSGTPVS